MEDRVVHDPPATTTTPPCRHDWYDTHPREGIIEVNQGTVGTSVPQWGSVRSFPHGPVLRSQCVVSTLHLDPKRPGSRVIERPEYGVTCPEIPVNYFSFVSVPVRPGEEGGGVCTSMQTSVKVPVPRVRSGSRSVYTGERPLQVRVGVGPVQGLVTGPLVLRDLTTPS